MQLEIVRTDATSSPGAPPFDVLATDVEQQLLAQAAFWPPIVDASRLLRPNSVGMPNPTPGGLANQYSAAGRFDLDRDHALVLDIGGGDAEP